MPNPRHSACNLPACGAPCSWPTNSCSGKRLCSFHGLSDRARPRPGRRSSRVSRPGRVPPTSRRSMSSSPPRPCTGLSAMRAHDRPGGYGGRHRHCSPPPGLLPFTREEAFEAFVVRPALSKFRIRRPLINRADLGYQLCGDEPGAVLSRNTTGVLARRNMEEEADCCLLRL